MNPFHKCLWILYHKFNCNRSPFMKIEYFNSLQDANSNLSKITFLVLPVVEKCIFNHVLVMWNEMIIDNEWRHTIHLSLENLKYICGKENEFAQLDHGCGIFLSRVMKRSMGQWAIGERSKSPRKVVVFTICLHLKIRRID